jgi:hypothetical protein
MENQLKILTILSMVLLFSFILMSVGIAYAGGVRGIGPVGVAFFLGLGITLVLAQLIPAAILFSSMIGAAFSSLRKGGEPIRAS